MATQAPHVPLTEHAQFHHAVVNPGALDLTGIAGFPDFPPQEVYFHNSTTEAQSAIYTPAGGAEVTVPLAPGATIRVPIPVSSIGASTGANIVLLAFWRTTNPQGCNINE